MLLNEPPVIETIYTLDVSGLYIKRVYTTKDLVKPDSISDWLLRGIIEPHLGVIEQLIVLEYQDTSVRYVYRTEQLCTELIELEPKHTLFIMHFE